MLDFINMAQECAPTVDPKTMEAIVKVESGFNPYAIGVVGGKLQRQPKSKEEAVATAKALELEGWNFSVGIAQINKYNLNKYSLTYEQAFEPCENLRVGSIILEDCYKRALKLEGNNTQSALQSAFSCYYSGNFTRGFVPDKPDGTSYVEKVLSQGKYLNTLPIVPMLQNEAHPRKTAPIVIHSITDENDPVLLQSNISINQGDRGSSNNIRVDGKDERQEQSAIVF